MKKYTYFFLLLVALLPLKQLFAQNFNAEEQHIIDSLNAIIINPNSHDTSLAGAYIDLSGALYVSNLDTMIPLCNKAEAIALKALKNNPTIAIKNSLLKSLSGSYNNKGFIYYNQGDIHKGLKFILKSLDVIKKLGDKEGLATGLNNVGYIFNDLGDVEKTIDYYHQSLRIEEEIGNKEGIATSLNNIGFIYSGQGNIEKALEYYYKSLYIYQELNNKHNISRSFNNIGSVIENKGDLNAALELYQKSLTISQELGSKKGVSNSYMSIGLLYEKKGEIDTALSYYKNSLQLREELDDKDGITMSLNGISKLLIEKNNINEAKEIALKSLKISQELGFPKNIQIVASLLSQIYEKEHNGMKALEMYKLSLLMRDSVNNESTQKATTMQQAKYNYEKQKTIDDIANSLALKEKQDEKEKQKILTLSTAGILVLVIIFLVFVFNRLQVTRKQKKKIELQNTELEVQKKIVEEKNEEITDSIYYAKRIQAAILPPDKVVKEYLTESFILYKPKDIVAGDFYWLEQKNGRILFAACDCTGHGVPGAMVSVVCVNGLNRSVREHGLTDPAEILNKTREIVIEEFEKSEEEVKDGMDVALCSLEFKIASCELKYAGANNPLWIIRKDASDVEEIKPNKQPIGKYSHTEPFTTHTIDLEKGDSIYIFSDGYADQFGGEKGKKFMLRSLKQLLLSVQDKELSEQKQIINSTFDNWKGDLNQIDDVCIIGVRI